MGPGPGRYAGRHPAVAGVPQRAARPRQRAVASGPSRDRGGLVDWAEVGRSPAGSTPPPPAAPLEPAVRPRPRPPERTVSFVQALWPILSLLALVVYGLILWPQAFGQPPLPLEVGFVLAAAFAVAELVVLGHRWADVQATIVAKLSQALPAFLIFLVIGMIIGSWMVCGTIPMRVV